VEEGYVHLLQPLLTRPGFKGIDRIIPIAMRRWKKSLFNKKTRMELRTFLMNLRSIRYDMVIETQGLLKAALVTRLAKRRRGSVIAGLANATEDSGYEPVSRWFYTQCVNVPKQCHAVDRSRLVAAAAMNVIQPDMHTLPPQFYPQAFVEQLAQKTSEISAEFTQPYVLFFHATARAAKQWDESHWVEVGRVIAAQGKRVILPWGNAKEKQVSQRLCSKIPGSVVPDAFSLEQAFSIVAGAEMTIGVDTGLTHLSAIMYKPTIEIYCDSPRWKTEGFWSTRIKNLGDTASPPDVKQVLGAIQQIEI
jgi:heptosyltransferase-1